jgi:phenylacetate-CoA ligase
MAIPSVDDGGGPVVEPGASGRIISTGLLFPGMPFIRYDTGDKAQLVARRMRQMAIV